MGRPGQMGKEASESPTTLAQLRNALMDEWNNILMPTVNALVNSIQRRIRAGRGTHEILITAAVRISF